MRISFHSTPTKLISVPRSTAYPCQSMAHHTIAPPFSFLCAWSFRAGATPSQRHYSNINNKHFRKIRNIEKSKFLPEAISSIWATVFVMNQVKRHWNAIHFSWNVMFHWVFQEQKIPVKITNSRSSWARPFLSCLLSKIKITVSSNFGIHLHTLRL